MSTIDVRNLERTCRLRLWLAGGSKRTSKKWTERRDHSQIDHNFSNCSSRSVADNIRLRPSFR